MLLPWLRASQFIKMITELSNGGASALAVGLIEELLEYCVRGITTLFCWICLKAMISVEGDYTYATAGIGTEYCLCIK